MLDKLPSRPAIRVYTFPMSSSLPHAPGTTLAPWLLALAALVPLTGCSGDQPARRPNIVLVTIDTLRADRVDSMGFERGLTPAMDELAAKSAAFRDAITPIATTGPAHASLFTGLPPRIHGLRWNGNDLAPDFATLAGLLNDEGYDTAAFVSMPLMLHGMNLGQGFITRSDISAENDQIRPGSETNRMAIEWLQQDRDKPYFLWVHYFDVHTPFELTEHAEQHLGDYQGKLRNGASTHEVQHMGEPNPKAVPWNDTELTALGHLYDGGVTTADALVAELSLALGIELGQHKSGKAQPIPKGSGSETVLIVTADHGELLGEHNHQGHGFQVWQEALRIPLIIHDPSAAPVQIDERVGLMDLFPTVLEFAGLQSSTATAGRSLVPAIRGESPLPKTYLAESRTSPGRIQPVAILKGDLKVVLMGNDAFGFDLSQDPTEQTRLDIDSSPELTELAEIARAYEATGEESTTSEKPSQERLDSLKALGYVE